MSSIDFMKSAGMITSMSLSLVHRDSIQIDINVVLVNLESSLQVGLPGRGVVA
jgi:hypothetical protein